MSRNEIKHVLTDKQQKRVMRHIKHTLHTSITMQLLFVVISICFSFWGRKSEHFEAKKKTKDLPYRKRHITYRIIVL